MLVFWDGGYSEAPIPSGGKLLIGRGADAGIRIDHPSVSRRHALLVSSPELSVEDLGSANGTRMNGTTLVAGQPTLVPSSALIEVGDAILRLEGESRTAPVASPTAASQMQAVRELIGRIARGSIPVTLTGETGVGKELLAERIHAESPRAANPFLRINCAALPEALLESELFGYERGAFTGANQPKAGLLEAANGGTVFLDEVGDLPRSMQAKLLRALECKEIFRVDSLRPRRFDVRFVAATNRDLETMVAEDAFRRDLYHRLCGVIVNVPPLRERTEELPELTETFVQQVASQLGRASPKPSDAFLNALASYGWPGNIRELRHTVECAVLLCDDGPLRPEHLPQKMRTSSRVRNDKDSSTLRAELNEMERQKILRTLDECGGNQTQAAKRLGLPRRTLISRIESYGLPRPRKGRGRRQT